MSGTDGAGCGGGPTAAAPPLRAMRPRSGRVATRRMALTTGHPMVSSPLAVPLARPPVALQPTHRHRTAWPAALPPA
eukprot:11176628-Lingulodinium_polyedra.AAC.1